VLTSASRRRWREDYAAYLQHWLTILKEDKRTIFSAAAHAQRAADFLNNLQPKKESWRPEGRLWPFATKI
jgi:antirestriction protein ArdC